MKEPNVEVEVEVKVWDLPTRVFHWVLVVLFAFQLVTGAIGGDLMDWHLASGYAIFVIVFFRILWGFAGSTPARFRNFLKGPRETLRFARRLLSREPVPWVGHNPLGGWMVLALIVSLALQVGTGLFSNDGVATQGPLAGLVSIEVSNAFSEFHDGNARVLFVLALLHIGGVVFHWLVKKDDLVTPMFTGVRRVPGLPPGVAPPLLASPWRALALLAAALAVLYLLVMGPLFRDQRDRPIALETGVVTPAVTDHTAPRAVGGRQ